MNAGDDSVPRPDPTQRLHPDASSVFVLQTLSWGVPFAIFVAVIASDLPDEVPAAVGPLATVAAFAIPLIALAVIPLRVRRWRWELRSDEVDVRKGGITEVRTIVPVARIQHVSVERTWVHRLFDAAEVAIHTAGGSVEIPVLDDDTARALRDRIADLALAPDEL